MNGKDWIRAVAEIGLILAGIWGALLLFAWLLESLITDPWGPHVEKRDVLELAYFISVGFYLSDSDIGGTKPMHATRDFLFFVVALMGFIAWVWLCLAWG